jgi:hypothetical protein
MGDAIDEQRMGDAIDREKGEELLLLLKYREWKRSIPDIEP